MSILNTNKIPCFATDAYYFEKAQIVRSYGNVHIIKENLNIFCDSAFFDGQTKKSKLWGRVKMRDGDYKLTTDSIDYDSASGRATYRNHGEYKKINSKERITSKVGYFYPDTKNYHFQDSVKYINESLTMTTDTLQFDYAKQTSYFFWQNKDQERQCEYCFIFWLVSHQKEFGLFTWRRNVYGPRKNIICRYYFL